MPPFSPNSRIDCIERQAGVRDLSIDPLTRHPLPRRPRRTCVGCPSIAAATPSALGYPSVTQGPGGTYPPVPVIPEAIHPAVEATIIALATLFVIPAPLGRPF